VTSTATASRNVLMGKIRVRAPAASHAQPSAAGRRGGRARTDPTDASAPHRCRSTQGGRRASQVREPPPKQQRAEPPLTSSGGVRAQPALMEPPSAAAVRRARPRLRHAAHVVAHGCR
jgi:hypothetical protein